MVLVCSRPPLLWLVEPRTLAQSHGTVGLVGRWFCGDSKWGWSGEFSGMPFFEATNTKKKHRTKIKKVFQLQSQESSRGINIWVTCRELGSISQGLSMLGCNQLKNACFFPRASNISTDFSTKTGWNSWYITSYPKFCWKVWGMIYHLRSLQWNAIHYVYIYMIPSPSGGSATSHLLCGGGWRW